MPNLNPAQPLSFWANRAPNAVPGIPQSAFLLVEAGLGTGRKESAFARPLAPDPCPLPPYFTCTLARAPCTGTCCWALFTAAGCVMSIVLVPTDLA